ncbi:MAG: HAMP domain-containing protein [Candidatus Abyssobacteria bacterium SURF_17]|uniref:histidine kinase n=1 Tax=Candidatus Abyssobacteria bacterium SURF_17 TaxID=2093361 RepID=A0A419EZK5_9BACT|nr:MAG: HAMP domain-containing protein [Candidatus Abyssubacteria bacterium SURF_17]
MSSVVKKRVSADPAEKFLVTAQRKLLKPRLQNKLILAFIFTAVTSVAVSTYLVVRITSELTENDIQRKIQEANSAALSAVNKYEDLAVESIKAALEKPGLTESLKKEKVSYIFTPPLTYGSKVPVGLWVPSGQPAPGSLLASSASSGSTDVTKTVMATEINGVQTLLAGAVAPIVEGDRQFGTLAIGYALGKSFAQDLEMATGANVRIFHEKIPTGPTSILFKGSSSELSESAIKEIEQIASIMRERPELELILEGHTDSTGPERQNYRLGLRRAKAVKDALTTRGIEPFRIQTISFGETRAVAPETTEEGKAMNRRVELEFKSREESLVGAIKDLPLTSIIRQTVFGENQRYYDRNALLKGEPYRAIYQPLVGSGGKVLGLIFVGIPKKYTFEATVGTWYFLPVILVIGFVLATVLGYTISRGISRPIRSLYRKVLAVADGDLDQQFEAETKDEIGDLGRAFNIMTKKLRQLRELEQEVQRRNRLAALGELSAGVAHEIRNPLGIIKNSAEMLRDRIQDDAKRRELAEYIVEEVARLNKVVTNFLQFARPSEPNLEMVDINSVLDHTIAFLQPEARSLNIKVEQSFAPNLPRVPADPEQCRQVFLNLCMNAFQAMNGEGTLTVKTRLEQRIRGIDNFSAGGGFSPPSLSGSKGVSDSMVEIIFTDTGEGIDPDVIARVFDPFFSTKDAGVGLGLSMVHKIIDNHNGRVRVTSMKGTGTTFTISLPVGESAQAEG